MDQSNFENIKNNILRKQLNEKKDVEFGCALPNRINIKELITNLLEIVYPGYYTTGYFGQCVEKGMEKHLDCIIERTFKKLEEQLKIAFKSQYTDEKELDTKANEIALAFFNKLPTVIEYALTDVEEAFVGDPAATDRNMIIATYPGIFATTIQRLAHELYLLYVPYIPRIMTEYAHSKTGIDIHPGATIGKYFFIDHGTGVVIGETTEIGEHVKVYQGVTLGAISTKDGQGLKGTKRHPTIKNGVTIYSDASVLGGATVIHDNVVIGGNAFITKSVYKKKKPEIDKDYFDYII